MPKHIRNWTHIVCCSILCIAAAAQSVPDVTSEQMFRSMRLYESMWRREPGPTTYSRGPWIPDSANFDETFRLRHLLEERAGRGDAVAMFYVGVIKTESAATFTKGSRGSQDAYESALQFFKQAGAGSVIDGYWNAALMYANGEGVVQSKLAAAEWFYKAGVGYVVADEREKALAALEAMQKLDANSSLARRLEEQLQRGAPK